ncbi:hypothetical protein NPIL_416741 [Nephila pilipes]|uniref:Uncharacterized protein n=1 Tax=Nephila pilipes TaxID=299642 RepID=A0A8X6QWN0_NEPPI|nr:hypothetical protein NPIL_416741 [Nephila pilipes]
MDIRYILASFAAVLCVTVVIAGITLPPPTQEDTSDVFSCIAKSGDQQLCDEFLKCFDTLPKKYRIIVNECMDKIPDGKTCSQDKELFNSEKDRMQFLISVRDRIPGEITAEELNELGKVQACFKAVADKCVKMKGSKP